MWRHSGDSRPRHPSAPLPRRVVVQAVGGSSLLAHPPKLAANEPFFVAGQRYRGFSWGTIGAQISPEPALWAGTKHFVDRRGGRPTASSHHGLAPFQRQL